MKQVNIYVQTSFRRPRKGNGWIGYVLETQTAAGVATLTDFKMLEDTTRHQAELLSVCKALERMTKPSEITIYTDSLYAASGFNSWVEQWQQNNWQSSRGNPVSYREEWERLLELAKPHKVTVKNEEHEYSGWLKSELARRAEIAPVQQERRNYE
ncbi:MAG: hypothetical protein IJ420_00520 [Lachnospiraceae bacterium]|nr:hypothetical protein [Lachnospiraceae bacterium]MBQ8632072.1 hypothetical protein [Lachnospiraceae bacterium]